MSRTGNADLIARVRSLTSVGTAEYTNGTANMWDADQIEQVLDRHRMDITRERLIPDRNNDAGGAVSYTVFRSAFGNMESGTALFIEDGVGDDRTAGTATANYSGDYQRGTFTFGADQAGTALYITARSYDLYGAAAEVLESWAGSAARDFDFSTDSSSFSRSQKSKAMLEQARVLRRRARARRVRLVTG